MSSNQGVPKVEPPCMVLFSVAPEPRLAIHILLFGEWEQICAFYAIVCSSWVPVNRGSTGRSIMTPLGCEDYPNVHDFQDGFSGWGFSRIYASRWSSIYPIPDDQYTSILIFTDSDSQYIYELSFWMIRFMVIHV